MVLPSYGEHIMKIVGLLRDLSEVRRKSLPSKMAAGRGLEKKPGWGAYGPKGTNIVTHRVRNGVLQQVPLHQTGHKPLLKGRPDPSV